MPEVRIGIAGYGTVGRGTAEALQANADEIAARVGARLRVSAVCRRTSFASDEVLNGARVVKDWRDLVSARDVDIVLETIGGTTVAFDIVRRTLELGNPVVTANKNLMAEHGDEIFALARKQNVPIGIEASVAGSIPIIRVLAEALCGDRLVALHGILNGTSNYILTRMEQEQLSFADALAEAQQAGYAEPDPAMDIEGIDSRDKLSILARLAFRCQVSPSAIPTTGIGRISAAYIRYASSLGTKVRLLASAELNEHSVNLSVRPWLVNQRSILSSVEGPNNAVLVEGE